MKNLLTFLLIILSLLTEVSIVASNHDCSLCSRLETTSSESAEDCETSLPSFKLRNEQRTTLRKPSVVAVIYQAEASLIFAGNVAKQRLHQHQIRQYNSPIYLSNRVFLI